MRPVLALAVLVLAGCASAPPAPVGAPAGSGDKAAGFAAKMVGKPYRYGGESPSSGFDCSGLVHYSFRQAGVAVPRTTAAQLRASQPVRGPMRRGDLLFFDQDGKKKSHVGIYLGHGRFVHAPSSGKRVRTDSLDSRYWKKHLDEVRRLL